MKDSQASSRHWNNNPVKQAGQADSDLAGWMAFLLIVVIGVVTISYAWTHGV